MKILSVIMLSVFFVIPAFSENSVAVVNVNGHEITEDEINFELGQIEYQAMIVGEQQKVPLNYARVEELRNMVIETLINKHLLVQACAERNIIIDAEEIEKNLLMLKNQFPEKQQYHNFLDQTGISENRLQEEIRTSLMIDLLATSELKSAGYEIGSISEEEKQKALARLLSELHEKAVIERLE